jgi:hypothetical protein
VVTETTPASVTRETCSDYRPVTSQSCSTVRQIQVDQHHRYQCVERMPDYCAAIKATEGCVPGRFNVRQHGLRRVVQSIHAPVSVHQRDGGDQPADGRALDTSYTIASNTLDTSGCTSLAESSNCVHAAHTCTDNTPCKTINGLQVCLDSVSPLPEGAQSAGDSCWAWSEDYTCAATALSDDCQELIDRGCTQVGSDCVDRAALGCLRPERAHLLVPDLAGGADAAHGVRSGGVLSRAVAASIPVIRPIRISARSSPRWRRPAKPGSMGRSAAVHGRRRAVPQESSSVW